MEIPIDHIQAWSHFYATFRKTEAWRNLSAKEKNTLIIADRDSRGDRLDKSGKPFGLGFKRVEGLLKKYAPEKYTSVNVRGFIINE